MYDASVPVPVYMYELADHLGNVHVVFHKDAGGNTVIDEAKDYYPYGLAHGSPMARVANEQYAYGYYTGLSVR